MRSRVAPISLALTLGMVITVVLSITGCAATSAVPASATSPLMPGYHFTHRVGAADAKAETEREADAIGALIPKSDVASTSSRAELYSSSGRSYYAVLRTITVTSGFNAVAKAEAIEKQLVAAGWTKHTATTDKDTGDYVAGLSSTTSATTSWFLLLGGNASPGKPSTISIQIGSPDLPGA